MTWDHGLGVHVCGHGNMQYMCHSVEYYPISWLVNNLFLKAEEGEENLSNC